MFEGLSIKFLTRFFSKVSNLGNYGGCWLWTAGHDNDGYGHIVVDEGKRKCRICRKARDKARNQQRTASGYWRQKGNAVITA